MIYFSGDLDKQLLKVNFLGIAVIFPIVYGFVVYGFYQEFLRSPQPWMWAFFACLVVLFLGCMALLFFAYRTEMMTNFEVDDSGIRVFVGEKTKRTATWQEFRYVGELKAFWPHRTGEGITIKRGMPIKRIIVCSPKQPTLRYGYTDVYEFSEDGAIAFDHFPETEQILKPYYKGTLSTDK